jgi:hypothetical protein
MAGSGQALRADLRNNGSFVYDLPPLSTDWDPQHYQRQEVNGHMSLNLEPFSNSIVSPSQVAGQKTNIKQPLVRLPVNITK